MGNTGVYTPQTSQQGSVRMSADPSFQPGSSVSWLLCNENNLVSFLVHSTDLENLLSEKRDVTFKP